MCGSVIVLASSALRASKNKCTTSAITAYNKNPSLNTGTQSGQQNSEIKAGQHCAGMQCPGQCTRCSQYAVDVDPLDGFLICHSCGLVFDDGGPQLQAEGGRVGVLVGAHGNCG